MAEVYNKGKLDILQQEFKQWGSGEGNFTFPISFTQTCFSVFLTRNRGGYEYSLIVASKSLTNVTWISRGHGNGGGDALGYILDSNRNLIKFLLLSKIILHY